MMPCATVRYIGIKVSQKPPTYLYFICDTTLYNCIVFQASDLHMTNCTILNHSLQLTPKCCIMYIKLLQSTIVTDGPHSSL